MINIFHYLPDFKLNLSNKGVFYWALTFILFIYILLRAIRVNITHDEALSWSILAGDTGRMFTANNHWLNTLLSWPLAWISNDQPWALRLPNVLSFGMYAYFVYKLTGSGKGEWFILIPVWIFLLANHYLLELFSLFRGYGLALACCAGAFYYARLLGDEWTRPRFLRFLFFALLTIYANYAFMYPLVGMGMWLFLHDWKSQLTPKQIFQRYQWLLFLSIPAFYNIIQLKGKNELYFGGENGILQDCLHSIIRYSFQFEIYPHQMEVFQWSFLGFLLMILLGWSVTASNRFSISLLFFCFLLPLPLHYWAGMKYPMERSLVFMTFLMGIAAFNSLASFFKAKSWFRCSLLFIPLIALSTATCYSTWYRVNLRYASTWYFDEHSEETLERIEALNPRKLEVRLGISWVLEPSLNYYRVHNNLDWLQALNREPLDSGGYDYYYAFEGDTAVIPDKGRLIHFYPDTRMALIQRK